MCQQRSLPPAGQNSSVQRSVQCKVPPVIPVIAEQQQTWHSARQRAPSSNWDHTGIGGAYRELGRAGQPAASCAAAVVQGQPGTSRCLPRPFRIREALQELQGGRLSKELRWPGGAWDWTELGCRHRENSSTGPSTGVLDAHRRCKGAAWAWEGSGALARLARHRVSSDSRQHRARGPPHTA